MERIPHQIDLEKERRLANIYVWIVSSLTIFFIVLGILVSDHRFFYAALVLAIHAISIGRYERVIDEQIIEQKNETN